LLTGDAAFASGTEKAKFFPEEVSPFAGFEEGYHKGFEELFHLLPAGRKILYATRKLIDEPDGWQLLAGVKGLQFVASSASSVPSELKPVPLNREHAEEMVQLAALTKPGPFHSRTIEFGHYHGFFENGKLAAMAGQRLHVGNYSEISAVCTHPDSLGKGYATALILQQIDLIRSEGRIPFLHVRDDNARAIAVYERLGFTVSGPMNFYFMKRRG